MDPGRKQLLTRVGYVAFGVLATLYFVYATFPIEALQGRITRQLELQGPWRISFERARPWRLTGIDAENVTVTYAGGGEPVSAKLDRVRARLELLPLLTKSYGVVYDVTLGDGSIHGRAKTSPAAISLELVATEVHLPESPLIGALLGVPILGDLSAKLDLVIDSEPKNTNGKGELELKNGATGEATVMGFTVPAIGLGQLSAAFEIKEGQLALKTFQQKSEHLEARITGDIGLRRQLQTSTLNLGLQFKLTESFLNENPKFRTIVQFSGLERTKNGDGFFAARLAGTIGMPMPSM